jgi:hypothetical protein
MKKGEYRIIAGWVLELEEAEDEKEHESSIVLGHYHPGQNRDYTHLKGSNNRVRKS